MNNFSKFSEEKLQEFDQEIRNLLQLLAQAQDPLHQLEILTDAQVCKILGVCERTMRTYRNKLYFHSVKIEGRILYVRQVFLQDLLRLNLHEFKNKK